MPLFWGGVSERRAREIAREEAEKFADIANKALALSDAAARGVGVLQGARYKIIDENGNDVALDLGGPNIKLYVVRIPDNVP